MSVFESARAWLASVDPAAPAALLVLACFAFVWLLRRSPKLWSYVEASVPFVTELDPGPVFTVVWKSWQALPGAIFGAVTAALFGGVSVPNAFYGVLAAAAASLTHEIMKAYNGEVAARKRSIPPIVGAGLCLLLAFASVQSLTGCAFFESKLPSAEKCLPTPADLAARVADILLAGGDYKTALEQLALTKTESLVVCAVKAFLSSPQKLGDSEDGAAAHARASSYLVWKGIK